VCKLPALVSIFRNRMTLPRYIWSNVNRLSHSLPNPPPLPLIDSGHTSTDTDSISSAIACAHLFDGIAARASDLNSETEFVLEKFGHKQPPPATDYVKSEHKVSRVHGRLQTS
jgi:hypothetical protein